MDTQSTGAGIAPLGFAIGITVVLVGLIVSPLVIAPLGGAITLAAGLAWGRANHSKTGLALLPSFLGQRRHPVDLGPTAAFPEGEFVVATFLADSQAGDVSRRAAYVRSNGLP